MIHRATRFAVLALALAFAAGTVAAQDDKSVQLQPGNLNDKLLRDIVGYYLQRDYKDKKDRPGTAELATLADLDKLAAGLKYSLRDGKPLIEFDARPKGAKPSTGDAAEKALRDLVRHSFSELAKDGIQLGADSPKFTLDAKLVAPLADSVSVLWAAAPPPPPPSTVDPRLADRLKQLEARLKESQSEIARLRSEGEGQKVQLARLQDLIRKLESTDTQASAAGRWAVVDSIVKTAWGCWYPITRWQYIPEKTATSRQGTATGLPARLATQGWKRGDAERLFWLGHRAYFTENYAEAWQSFEAATQLAPSDARAWYFRALAERALGEPREAENSRLAGLKVEAKGNSSGALARALERVQGESRLWLRQGR